MLAACSVDRTTMPQNGNDLSMPQMLADLAGNVLRDLSQQQQQTGDMTMSSGAYPAGPYGHNVGDTINPLVWEGYPDPLADAVATSKTYGAYSMDDLRRSGKPYGVVHVAEFF
jgi:hypothetical protein